MNKTTAKSQSYMVLSGTETAKQVYQSVLCLILPVMFRRAHK